MNSRKLIKLLPLLIVVACSLFLLWMAATNSVSLVKKQIAGLALLAITVILQFINTKAGFIATGILLFIGAFAFITFTPAIHTSTIRFHSLSVNFDEYCLPVFILYLVIHRKEIPGWIAELRS